MINKLCDIDIICLTSGKCGSSTLNKTLKKNGYKSIKVHGKEDFINQYNYDGLIDLINESSKNKKIYLIDSYRTPIERKISSFFQNLKSHVPNYNEKTIKDLIDIFNTDFLQHIEEQESIDCIMLEYGLKLFDSFDFKKRYILKQKGNIVFVKILFSDINKWDKILSDILNKEIKMHDDNISSNKEYYKLYNDFKTEYKIPKSYIDDKLKNNKYFKIFNTLNEQKEYINKWLKSSF